MSSVNASGFDPAQLDQPAIDTIRFLAVERDSVLRPSVHARLAAQSIVNDAMAPAVSPTMQLKEKMMKGVDPMQNNATRWTRAIALVVLGFGSASCANNRPTVPEAEYSTRIVGRWQGTAGDLKETMSIHGNGTFVCQLHPRGFIANILSQGVAGTIRGTWTITGSIITLRITAAENERLASGVVSSTIMAFNEDGLVLKSDRGDTSSFRRVLAL